MTPNVPGTGVFTMVDIGSAFPGITAPHNLLSYVGVHPNVSSVAPIDMMSFKGITAVSPIHSSTTQYDTGVAGTANATVVLTDTTLGISTTGNGTLNHSITLSTYLTNPSYHGTMSYTASVAMPTGITLDATTGIITINPALINTGSTALAYSLTISATNKWGNINALAVTFNFAASKPPREYPPAGLTGATTVISGQAYGNGTYIVNQSRQATTTRAGWRICDYGIESWQSTTLGNTNGDWVEITLPTSILLTSFWVNFMTNTIYNRSPPTFSLHGSREGSSTLELIGNYSKNMGVVTYTIDSPTNTILFNRFRLTCTTHVNLLTLYEMRFVSLS